MKTVEVDGVVGRARPEGRLVSISRFSCEFVFVRGMRASTAAAGTARAADMPERMPARSDCANCTDLWSRLGLLRYRRPRWRRPGSCRLRHVRSGRADPDATLSGGHVGGHAGENWQEGQVAGLLEEDDTAADLNQSSLMTLPGFDLVSRQPKVDQRVLTRRRLSSAAPPNLFRYGTGGGLGPRQRFTVRAWRLSPHRRRMRSVGWRARIGGPVVGAPAAARGKPARRTSQGHAFPAYLPSSATSTPGMTSTSFAAVSGKSSGRQPPRRSAESPADCRAFFDDAGGPSGVA
jgi:hypothetical protein